MPIPTQVPKVCTLQYDSTNIMTVQVLFKSTPNRNVNVNKALTQYVSGNTKFSVDMPGNTCTTVGGTLTTMGNTTLNGSQTQTVSGNTKFSFSTAGYVSATGTLSVTGNSTLTAKLLVD